jgi:hypothetical protein
MPARSDGAHVSTLVLAMLQDVGKAHRGWGKGGRPERAPTYEAGYAFEDALALALSKRLKLDDSCRLMPPIELSVDGVAGTPDRLLYDFRREGWIVEETKFTWMSCAAVAVEATQILSDARLQYWVIQSKTYAAMLRHYVLSPANRPVPMPARPHTPPPLVRIRAFFANGDYRGSLATPLCWEFEYENEELDAWWRVMVDYRDTALALATTDAAQPPEDPSHAQDHRQHPPHDVRSDEG